MAKSLTQEMAREIARIAQTRVVEAQASRWTACASIVEPTRCKWSRPRTEWATCLLNDRVLFSMDRCTEARARAFFLNASRYFYVTDAKINFGTTDVIVANISATRDEEKWERDRPTALCGDAAQPAPSCRLIVD